MKYIAIKTPDGKEWAFTFDGDLTHADFAASIHRHKEGVWASRDKTFKQPFAIAIVVGAGFIRDGTCFGESESCNVKSRGYKDTELIFGAHHAELKHKKYEWISSNSAASSVRDNHK